MDTHVTLTELAVRAQHAGATAFSALPDAPVLPVTERRRPLAALHRALAGGRRTNVAPKPAPGRERPAAARLPAAGPLCG